MTPLFLDTSIKLEKVANYTKLEDDPDRWAMEILKAGYKNLPSLRNYEADVEIDRIDAARGYAVGKMLLYPTGITKEAASGMDKLISVPVIVRDHELAPMDVYSHKEQMYPMDERDLQEIMIRPESFTGVAPRDGFKGTPIGDMITPPDSAHQSGGHMGGGVIKQASKNAVFTGRDTRTLSELQIEKARLKSQEGQEAAVTEIDRLIRARNASHDETREEVEITSEKRAGKKSLWEQAIDSADPADMKKYQDAVNSELGVKFAFENYPALDPFRPVEMQLKTAADMRDHRHEITKPSVVQFTYENGAFMTKVANRECWAPRGYEVSRYDIQKELSPANFGQLLSRGVVTLTVNPTVSDPFMFKTAEFVDRAGWYRVYSGGVESGGFAVPFMKTLDGVNMDIQLFANPQHYAMQEKIAGFHHSNYTLPVYAPRGYGCFVYQEGERAFAYEPLTVQNKVVTESGYHYLCKRASTGEELVLHPSKDIAKLVGIGNGGYLVPSSLKWLPLEKKRVGVSDDLEVSEEFDLQKNANHGRVGIHFTSDGYTFDGPNAAITKGLTYDPADAEFILGGLGIAGKQARELLKTAQTRGGCQVMGTVRIIPEDERLYESAKVASKKMGFKMPKCDLTKEAAVLSGPKAVELWKTAGTALPKESLDAILSLNFLTAENASIYLNHLPLLEKCSSVLAELLVASRLGMDDIREAAAKNAMTQINAVIRGLEQMGEKTQ